MTHYGNPLFVASNCLRNFAYALNEIFFVGFFASALRLSNGASTGIGIKGNYPRLRLPLRARAIIANARPFTLLLPTVGGWLIIQASLGSFDIPTPRPLFTLAAIGSMALLNASGNYVNSVFDLEIDRINKPWRAIPSGAISQRAAFAVAVGMVSLALILGILVSRTFGVLVGIDSFFVWAYSVPPFRLKRILWASNVVQALVRGVVSPLAVWTVYNSISNPAIIGLTILMFTLIVGGQSIKDIGDIAGDLKYGVRTLPGVYGIAKTYKIITISVVISIFELAAIDFLNLITNATLMMAVFTPIAGVFLYSLGKKRQTITENTLSWNLFYISMIGLILSFTVALSI